MKKIVVGLICLVGFGFLYVVMQQQRHEESKAVYTIGILQTASHPALDAVARGFQEELQRLMGDTPIACVVQNAQGSVASAHTIAQQFHGSKKYDLFFTIATPAAQAMHAVEKQRPIIIAAVTDPAALDLVYQGSNVSGVTDMIDVPAQVSLLQKLVPTAKNIGIVFTTGETNSLVLVARMKSELIKAGLNPIEFAVGCESDVQAVMQVACRKSDCIVTPTDNTVASTISLIASIARSYKKPLIVSDNMLVAAGALASCGVDYQQTGQQAAQCACALLIKVKNSTELPVEQPVCNQVYVNQETVQLLEIAIPEDLRPSLTFVS